MEQQQAAAAEEHADVLPQEQEGASQAEVDSPTTADGAQAEDGVSPEEQPGFTGGGEEEPGGAADGEESTPRDGDYEGEGDGEDSQQGYQSGNPSTSGALQHSTNAGDDDDEEEEDDDMPMPNRLELLSARSHSNSSSRPSRPPSAVMDLRGSRPNSAAIAQEIEGFEDDFMERVEEEEEEYEMEEEDEEEQEMGPSVAELIERAHAEQTRLQEANEALQKKARLAMDFRNKGRPAVNRDTSRLDGVAVRYRSSLKQWVELLEDRDRVEGHYQATVFDMKSGLEERIKRADDISKAYKHFRLEVARSAEHSKTARPISDRLLSQLEKEDQEKEEEVQRVRLKNIHLTNQLKRIEQTLRQKEELAEGLHLIDFEQLKIENQSLNEKIEERNEELLKLRKKTTTTVQILTHIREKLQFIEKENGSLAGQLDELDKSLSERRDTLGKAKASRDALRQKGRKIKETSVFITHPTLLGDIEGQKEKKEQLLFVIDDLKREHTLLSDLISKSNTKIINMTQELASAGAPNVANIMRSLQSSKSRVGASRVVSRAESTRSGGPVR